MGHRKEELPGTREPPGQRLGAVFSNREQPGSVEKTEHLALRLLRE
jgi:hypothetical protein